MTTGKRRKILLVDDHPLVRERLAEIINAESDLIVCGQAESTSTALAAISTTKPDLAVVDLTLKDSHGLDLIKDIKIQHPELRTLVVSMHDESLYAERAIRAGTNGYITKQGATRNILVAIRQVLSGRLYVSSQLMAELLRKMVGQTTADVKLGADKLTDRELQVLELIGHGLSTRQIASQLHLDIKTIESYRARLKEKFDLPDAPALLQFAIRWVGPTR